MPQKEIGIHRGEYHYRISVHIQGAKPVHYLISKRMKARKAQDLPIHFSNHVISCRDDNCPKEVYDMGEDTWDVEGIDVLLDIYQQRLQDISDDE